MTEERKTERMNELHTCWLVNNLQKGEGKYKKK